MRVLKQRSAAHHSGIGSAATRGAVLERQYSFAKLSSLDTEDLSLFSGEISSGAAGAHAPLNAPARRRYG